VATGFQTINQSIICENVNRYRSDCIAVSCEKKGKVKFEGPDSSVVGSGAVSTGKTEFPQENISYICRIQHRKNNGFLFTK